MLFSLYVYLIII